MGSPHEDDRKSMYTLYNAIILMLYTCLLLLLLCLQSYCSASNINFIVVTLYIPYTLVKEGLWAVPPSYIAWARV